MPSERVQRIRYQLDAERIAYGLRLLPERIAERVAGVHFLTGTDPVFAGLHHYTSTATHGLGYGVVAHCVYECHQRHLPRARRATTVVLPNPSWYHVQSVVHELGHVLDEQTGWEVAAVPVTDYAEKNRYEAFAEAFAAWVMPVGWRRTNFHYDEARDRLYRDDRRFVAFLEGLADEDRRPV